MWSFESNSLENRKWKVEHTGAIIVLSPYDREWNLHGDERDGDAFSLSSSNQVDSDIIFDRSFNKVSIVT